MAIALWVEKYRPVTLDDYVWQDDAMRDKTLEWLAEGGLPHLLLSGPPGSGKTSLSELLMHELAVPEDDILRIAASRDRKIDDVQERVLNFAQAWAMGSSGLKYVLFDEFDAISPMSQLFLRTEMERSADTTRFICTANARAKIIDPLRSRFQEFQFRSLDHDQFLTRVCSILLGEGVDVDPEVMEGYVNRCYPDLRKCINMMQQNCIAGALRPPPEKVDDTKDYLVDALALFSAGKLLAGRKLIIEQAQPEDYDGIYRFFYENLDLFGEQADRQDDALLIIKQAVVNRAFAADQEILLSATLVELCRVMTA